MSRVLVVEQRQHGRAGALLDAEGFAVVVALHLNEAIASIGAVQPELVLIEAVAPTTIVLAVCAGIRAVAAAPVALLSGPCTERDCIDAFGVGIDSVIVEPVGNHELVARVRALVRRAPTVQPDLHDRVQVGPVTLDRGRREVSVHNEQIRIPRREFDIAELLMLDAGRVVTRQRLVRELWGSVRDTKSLDVQVGRLRARLAAVEGVRRIVTVRGVGFRFLLDGDPDLLPTVVDLTSEIPEVDDDDVAVVDDLLEGTASA
jgi:two-component system response regulator RegX3